MRNHLSFGETLAALTISAMLIAPQALAQLPDYSTDTGEPDIRTVKNDHCCLNAHLKQEANVKINIKHSIFTSYKPVTIQVLDASQQEVARVVTRDKVVYMHLPEGKYTLKVEALMDHTTLSVDASDAVLKSYIM